MLTKYDLCEQLGVTIEELAYMHAKKITPQPIRIGDEYRWRVEDVELFKDYLRDWIEYEANGGEPHGPEGPAPPVYSMGIPAFDPREAMARIRERERQAKSKTLAAGSKPIPAEKPVKLPTAADITNKVG